jgi:hypothetical protein
MTRPARSSSADASAGLPAAEKQRSNGPRTYTYVPPFKLIQEALRIGQDDLDADSRVSIPVAVLKTLMAHLLKKGFFDERWYVESNPDVDNAIKNGKITDAFEHYIWVGYYEGRSPGPCSVDREWYERHYSDVGLAIKSGRLVDSAEHFHHTGYHEGRAPSEDQLSAAETWRKLLSK